MKQEELEKRRQPMVNSLFEKGAPDLLLIQCGLAALRD